MSEKSKEYSVDDLVVIRGDEAVRQRPELWIGRKSQMALAQALASDVLLDEGSCTVVRRDGWWILVSERDWVDEHRGEASVEEFFGGSRRRLFPNVFHVEWFVAVLADPVLTATPERRWVIKGEAFEERLIEWATAAAPNWARLVAFRWDDVSAI